MTLCILFWFIFFWIFLFKSWVEVFRQFKWVLWGKMFPLMFIPFCYMIYVFFSNKNFFFGVNWLTHKRVYWKSEYSATLYNPPFFFFGHETIKNGFTGFSIQCCERLVTALINNIEYNIFNFFALVVVVFCGWDFWIFYFCLYSYVFNYWWVLLISSFHIFLVLPFHIILIKSIFCAQISVVQFEKMGAPLCSSDCSIIY